MGLFKRKPKQKPITISGAQLMLIIEKAVETTEVEVNSRCFTMGPSVIFEYGNDIHFVEIKYDKRSAKREHLCVFKPALMSIYIDDVSYASIKDVRDSALIDDILLSQITEGIVVDAEYRELLGL